MNRLLPLATIALAATVFLDTAAAQQPAPSRRTINLLTNPSFEEGESGWSVRPPRLSSTVTIDTTEVRDGKASLHINNPEAGDVMFYQKITVKPNTRYRLSGTIKTKDVLAKTKTNDQGANLCLWGGYEHTEWVTKSKNWTKVSMDFESGARTDVEVGARLGFYYAPAAGKAWFDELELVELGPSRKR